MLHTLLVVFFYQNVKSSNRFVQDSIRLRELEVDQIIPHGSKRLGKAQRTMTLPWERKDVSNVYFAWVLAQGLTIPSQENAVGEVAMHFYSLVVAGGRVLQHVREQNHFHVM